MSAISDIIKWGYEEYREFSISGKKQHSVQFLQNKNNGEEWDDVHLKQRVFSTGGIFLQPHRSRLTSKVLSVATGHIPERPYQLMALWGLRGDVCPRSLTSFCSPGDVLLETGPVNPLLAGNRFHGWLTTLHLLNCGRTCATTRHPASSCWGFCPPHSVCSSIMTSALPMGHSS
ncbi:uncharacterized protein LOC110986295 [Acanthaster planci]|uniref:Uncharacterized protein LOC110986295 n=1 Tax=Acanthaster planci TaxID=133434 RepID=A0A8B7ZFW0_ACAPL|nr:uncharacterized protein LOC110986295 [Acanthaster planci]